MAVDRDNLYPWGPMLDMLADVPRRSLADKVEALRSATQDFVRRSRGWREWLPMAQVERSEADVLLPGSTLWRLDVPDGRRLSAVLAVEGVHYHAWHRYARPAGGAEYLAILDVAAIARARQAGSGLQALMQWAPERGREGDLPAEWWSAWGWAIAQGARARLGGESIGGGELAMSDFTRAAEDCLAEADKRCGLNQHVLAW